MKLQRKEEKDSSQGIGQGTTKPALVSQRSGGGFWEASLVTYRTDQLLFQWNERQISASSQRDIETTGARMTHGRLPHNHYSNPLLVRGRILHASLLFRGMSAQVGRDQ